MPYTGAESGARAWWRGLMAVLLVFLLCGVPVTAHAGRRPPRDLLGIRVGMTDQEVRNRLAKIAKGTPRPTREGSDRELLWSLRDRRFMSILIRFDPAYELQWATAYVRTGKQVRYRDVADTTQARRAGRFIYVWSVPQDGRSPGFRIVARGTDPRFLSSVSIAAESAAPDTASPTSGRGKIR